MTPDTSDPRPKIQSLRTELMSRFPERRDVIQGSLAAIIAGEHLLLLGPPGTAKSALVRAIAQAFAGTYFERLLTKFSTPEELFGPVSLRALEQDRFARVTTDKLPEAEFVFVDEVFKANSAILNSLLTALNERVYHNDGPPTPMPLVSLFGASNELPDGRELEALFDRFLLRYDVQYLVRPSAFRAVLRAPEPVCPLRLSMEVLRAAQAAAEAVTVTDATLDALITIRDAARAEGIVASDRRWKKTLRIVKAEAYLAGESSTTPEDLLVLTHALWREPKEAAKVAQIVGQVADPVSARAAEILDAAREIAAKVASLKSADRKAYITQAATALEDFVAQRTRLRDLAAGAGPRARLALTDADQEIAQLHAGLAQSVSAGLGLGGAR